MSRLSLQNLSKRFGEKLLFSDLSYDFPEAGLYLLIGASGRGKTTLLRMIAGLDTDFQGRILGGGSDAVAMVFQEHRLFPALTALDNVAEVLRAEGCDRRTARHRATEALLAVGYPEEALAKRPAILSGGMRQRVSLARALASGRGILLLDEPEKDLDTELRHRLHTLLAKEAKRRLVLLVTHTPEPLLPLADGTLSLPEPNVGETGKTP
ncbi:MAG: ABC transporter ATP-binding protein [Clostridia bacterium]|nr:ABC transporter ATP-binding protein [Clostridia bacterium]